MTRAFAALYLAAVLAAHAGPLADLCLIAGPACGFFALMFALRRLITQKEVNL